MDWGNSLAIVAMHTWPIAEQNVEADCEVVNVVFFKLQILSLFSDAVYDSVSYSDNRLIQSCLVVRWYAKHWLHLHPTMHNQELAWNSSNFNNFTFYEQMGKNEPFHLQEADVYKNLYVWIVREVCSCAFQSWFSSYISWVYLTGPVVGAQHHNSRELGITIIKPDIMFIRFGNTLSCFVYICSRLRWWWDPQGWAEAVPGLGAQRPGWLPVLMWICASWLLAHWSAGWVMILWHRFHKLVLHLSLLLSGEAEWRSSSPPFDRLTWPWFLLIKQLTLSSHQWFTNSSHIPPQTLNLRNDKQQIKLLLSSVQDNLIECVLTRVIWTLINQFLPNLLRL